MINNFFTLIRSAALLLFLLLATTVSANDTDYTKEYYPTINQAELSILQKDYATALTLYQAAFKAVPSPFARDYYNAAVCAMLLKDKKQSVVYLEQLATKGVSIDYLGKQPVFDSLKTTKQWRKFKRKYPKYRKQYDRQVNLDLRADLDELYARDQYFRQAEGGLRVYGDTLRKIEKANTEQFLAWVEKYGFPGESLVGVGDTLEHLPRFSIIIQRQTKARKGHDFTGVLKEAVQQGRISPQAAAYLLEQQAGASKYGSKAFVKVSCNTCEDKKPLRNMDRYLEEKRSAKETESINARRKKLGLETLEDYKKKVLYSMDDKRFKLNYDWSVVNYQVPSTEAAKIMMERFVVADAE
ncbi:hypothetical protein [uncultured Pontibacter sp.]|uniref:hypothetical protein n=1 Tax=uncultured Pontibacter sp. TaxID=453356 RepID=UPI00262DF2E3|nr:hypothetical protein [uncultured Pontibacter sp.]